MPKTASVDDDLFERIAALPPQRRESVDATGRAVELPC